MTFQPVVIGPGIVGWKFLQRTYESQFETFSKSPQIKRDTEYFLETIGSIKSARELVGDRRLLSVALGAFGLQDDIDNRYFIQRILEDGTSNDDALANRLSDDRYKQLSKAFRFGPGEVPNTSLTSKMIEITDRNRVQSFEIAVGEQDDSMRIAMFAARELAEIAGRDSSDNAKWFTMMGLPPLRQMFETAFGLPRGLGKVDIDKQAEIFRTRTRSALGSDSMEQFANPSAIERLTSLYLARTQIAQFNASMTPGANALQLLSAANG